MEGQSYLKKDSDVMMSMPLGLGLGFQWRCSRTVRSRSVSIVNP